MGRLRMHTRSLQAALNSESCAGDPPLHLAPAPSVMNCQGQASYAVWEREKEETEEIRIIHTYTTSHICIHQLLGSRHCHPVPLPGPPMAPCKHSSPSGQRLCSRQSSTPADAHGCMVSCSKPWWHLCSYALWLLYQAVGPATVPLEYASPLTVESKGCLAVESKGCSCSLLKHHIQPHLLPEKR